VVVFVLVFYFRCATAETVLFVFYLSFISIVRAPLETRFVVVSQMFTQCYHPITKLSESHENSPEIPRPEPTCWRNGIFVRSKSLFVFVIGITRLSSSLVSLFKRISLTR